MKRVLLVLPLLAAPAAAGESLTVTCGEDAVEACQSTALAELTARLGRERDQVAAFLGLPARPIAVHIGDHWRGRPVEVTRAWPEFGRVVIPPRILARGIVPSAHEITHVLAGRAASATLTEGLAVLTHARFGEQPAFPNFGQPLEPALAALLVRLPPLARAPALAEVERWIEDFTDGGRRRLGYLIAGLFCEHLLTERFAGDRERFFQLYRSGDYAAALGADGEAAFARWWAARAS